MGLIKYMSLKDYKDSLVTERTYITVYYSKWTYITEYAWKWGYGPAASFFQGEIFTYHWKI